MRNMRMKHFKYKVDVLINGIRERPVLWDKTLDTYKDREERKEAWGQIFRLLEEEFDEMSRQDQKATADLITCKWTNIRDTFMKSLRNQTMKSNTRRYVYHDEMSFLLKVISPDIIPDYSLSDAEEDPISCNMKQEMTIDESEGETSMTETKLSRKSERGYQKFLDTPEHDIIRKKRSKRSEKRQPEEESLVNFAETDEVQDPRIMNEDEAFFASLLPTVVKYSEEERLEFRIEVLAVMKNINEKRKQVWSIGTDE